ncbi:Thymidylate kinase [Spiroplasma sp. JKS002669]|uniref:dTMP kinase n=1 Tax=Spiroplasma attinicola TaxID=2904537 RepID=UPI002022FDAE|nr:MULTISPECIES: dTMP kinase [unclassified Spiroplasma]MCL6428836.1 Thymidylate kinase [Spiroplasma sp. JKS002669]MCL8210172.1 Thymidylate kinase [Spiroplasma sp. JKS002670]MCL8210679.1 Thymidylate kinase [Spiroplasma sp. JKS002671]
MTMIFISFEGPEGSGKSSVLAKLKERFSNEGIEITTTREPGGSIISEQIRKIILNETNTLMDAWTEVLLYIAARRQHLVEKIFPEKNSKKIIICDRFSDSTLAYQGYGRKLDIKKINTIQDIAFDNFKPNLTILFNVKPEIGLQRIKERSKSEQNRLDNEDLSFHQLVYQGYQEIAKNNQDRIKVIDASKSFEQVLTETYQIIKQFITK